MHYLQSFVLFLLVIYTLPVSVQSCIKQEREALLKFRAGLSDPSNRLASWSGDKCCNWAGIRCSNQTGGVTELDLSNPYSYMYRGYKSHTLIGTISSSILALSGLEYLDLSWNNFGEVTGVPNFIGTFEKLKYLNLSSAGFSGTIPSQLGNLSRLQYLDVSNNYGLMASADISWLSHLQSLRHLDMSQVNLHDSKEWVQSLNKLPALEVLILDNNSLTHIPQSLPFVNFTSLRVLHISTQNFSTTIPDWIFSLQSLTDLNLDECRFVGSFPVALGNLTSLSKLVLGCSGLQGKIPPLNNLTKLTYVDLSCILNGEPIDIAEVLSRFSRETRRKLEGLILFDTHLTGNLTGLAREMPNLRYLDLFANRLSGPIPVGFWNLTNLVEVDLSVNSLAGSLTDACLKHLPKLEVLLLGGNQLGGKVPSSLQFCRGLVYLDLGENNFHGEIPQWIGENLSKLMFLRMNSNLFSGKISSKLAMLNKLRILDLADNNLSGSLPENLGSFTGMSSLKNDADVPSDPWYMDLSTSIDLSNNHLTGKIPRNIIALIGLVNLNLSHNHLIGEIPAEIEKMRSLQSLDLHLNNLSGRIPQSISDLNSLKVLNLSYNNLSGSIPTNHQLHKLDVPSIYTGNPYLCGPPLENSCFDSETSADNINNSGHVSHREKWWLYLFIEFGFVVGCFVVFLVLLFILVASTFKRYGKH